MPRSEYVSEPLIRDTSIGPNRVRLDKGGSGSYREASRSPETARTDSADAQALER